MEYSFIIFISSRFLYLLNNIVYKCKFFYGSLVTIFNSKGMNFRKLSDGVVKKVQYKINQKTREKLNSIPMIQINNSSVFFA